MSNLKSIWGRPPRTEKLPSVPAASEDSQPADVRESLEVNQPIDKKTAPKKRRKSSPRLAPGLRRTKNIGFAVSPAEHEWMIAQVPDGMKLSAWIRDQLFKGTIMGSKRKGRK
jgi:hypothetical protein